MVIAGCVRVIKSFPVTKKSRKKKGGQQGVNLLL